jgi:hypothetical protein
MQTILLLRWPPAWVGLRAGGDEHQNVTGQNTGSHTSSQRQAAGKAAQLLTENPDRWIWLEVRRHAGGVAWSFAQYLQQRPTSRNAAVIRRIAEAVKGIVEDAFMK